MNGVLRSIITPPSFPLPLELLVIFDTFFFFLSLFLNSSSHESDAPKYDNVKDLSSIFEVSPLQQVFQNNAADSDPASLAEKVRRLSEIISHLQRARDELALQKGQTQNKVSLFILG